MNLPFKQVHEGHRQGMNSLDMRLIYFLKVVVVMFTKIYFQQIETSYLTENYYTLKKVLDNPKYYTKFNILTETWNQNCFLIFS